MDAAAAALEELLNTGGGDESSTSVAANISATILGWHSGVMGPLRGQDTTARFRDQELSMTSSLPGDDVTSTTPPPATSSGRPPQLSPNNRSGMSNANGAGHPTNSIRGK